MISLITVIILAFTTKFAGIDTDMLVIGPILGILLEVLLIWTPFTERDKWFKKMSYFKYLYKMMF